MQSLHCEPDLVLGIIDVQTDTRQPSNPVLVKSEEAVLGDCDRRTDSQTSGLLGEFDQSEEPISLNTHVFLSIRVCANHKAIAMSSM